MRKLKLIIDADSVLAKTITHLLELYNKEYNLDFMFEDVSDFYLPNIQVKDTNMEKYFRQRGFFYDLEPVEGAQEYVNKLIQDGHDIIVATAAQFTSFEDKYRWLRRYFINIPKENIMMAVRKDLIKGDIMLDDGLHNISKSICDYAVIFDRPWNRVGDNEHIRIYNWKEFYEFVYKIANTEDENELVIDKEAI